MPAHGFALFETPIGCCAIAWGPRGVAGVELPAASAERTRARMRRRFPDAREAPPPPDVARVVEGIRALLRGEASDLAEVAFDLDAVPAFERRVYEVARSIPPGATATYGEIARRVGAPDAAREVGRALGRNPFPLVVPCHRVVAAGGRIGGFSAPGGAAAKRRLLAIEGAPAGAPRGRRDADPRQPSLFRP